MGTQHTTGIVTVSYGSGDALTVFLSSYFEQHPLFPAQNMVVVDNKPDHENVADIAHAFGVQYVPLPTNPGYGAGMNTGAEVLLGPGEKFASIFFCNPDLKFIEPVIDQLSGMLQNDPALGSIGPRLLNIDGSVYPSARNIPSLTTGIGHGLFGRVWPNNPWSQAYKKSNDYDRTRSAGSLSGAAVMTPVAAYQALQGWDEAYFMHFEDIDLGWRLSQLGYTNLFFPSVSVEHTGGHSTEANAAVVEQAMTNSAIRFMNKRYAGFWKAPLRWVISLALRIRGILRMRSITQSSSANNNSRLK